jgi:AbrB family looped-hinge helix DNA binding protein
MVAQKKPKSAHVRLGRQGRLVLPADMRQELGVHDGDMLIVRLEDGRLVIETPDQLLDRMQALFDHIPKGVSLAEELIAERRAEAKREEEEE